MNLRSQRKQQFVIIALVSAGLLFSISTTSSANRVYQRATLTPLPTQIPLPERPESLSDIQALLQEADEICELPCFWGIRPGYTLGTDVIKFLEPNTNFSSARKSYGVEYYFREKGEQQPIFSINVDITDEIASLTQVIVDSPSEWLPEETLELPHVLSIMQSTPQAYLSISLGQRRIFLTIAYDEGVLAQYPFTLRIGKDNVVSPNSNESFLFCPELKANAYIILRLRNANAQLMLKERGILSDAANEKIWPVERMTGMKINEFVEQIIANPDECIKLPSYPELVEMGYEF